MMKWHTLLFINCLAVLADDRIAILCGTRKHLYKSAIFLLCYRTDPIILIILRLHFFRDAT